MGKVNLARNSSPHVVRAPSSLAKNEPDGDANERRPRISRPTWFELVRPSKARNPQRRGRRPSVLSCEVKKQLTTYSPETAAKLLVETIEEINHGNVAKIETLLKKKLAMK